VHYYLETTECFWASSKIFITSSLVVSDHSSCALLNINMTGETSQDLTFSAQIGWLVLFIFIQSLFVWSATQR